MDTRLNKARQKYFSLLGVQNAREAVESIEARIRDKLGGEGNISPPIRLATVARSFQIDPDPRPVRNKAEGHILFDGRSGDFRISLSVSRRGVTSKGRRVWDLRHRFTYAHEFAHRFFFVQSGNTWVRAVDLACKTLDQRERGRLRPKIIALEERLCNEIASDLLIPRADFIDKISLVGGLVGESSGAFWEQIARLARRYKVSQECLLVRLAKIVNAETTSWPDDFIVLLVERTDRDEMGKRSQLTERVKTAIVGMSFRRHFYPRMPAERLGPDLSSFVREALSKGTTKTTEDRMLCIEPPSGDGRWKSKVVWIDMGGHTEWRTGQLQNRALLSLQILPSETGGTLL